MKNILKLSILVIIYFSISKTLYSQDIIKETKSIISFSKYDTIQHNVNLFQNNPVKETFIEKYFPSLVIIFISLLTIFANFYFTNKQLKSAFINNQNQINSALEIKLKELNQQKQLTEKELKYSFISNNRHLWISNFQNYVCKYLTVLMKLLNLKKVSEKGEKKSEEEIELINKFFLYKYNISLHLYNEKSHIELETLLLKSIVAMNYKEDAEFKFDNFASITADVLMKSKEIISEEKNKILNAS